MPSTYTSTSDPPIQKAVHVIKCGLTEYFESTCLSRHDIRIPTEWVCLGDEEGKETDAILKFDLPGSLFARAHLHVCHDSGNVCDVGVVLEERDVHSFSLCLTPGPLSSVAPSVGDRIGEVLLSDLKDLVGTRVLQDASLPAASS